MIGKTSRGGGARGLLDYLFGPGEHHQPGRARLVGGTMGGWDARSLAREFGEVRQLRPDIKKPVKHISFSVEPSRRLTDEQWLEVARREAKQRGWDTWCLIRHDDEPHDHVHLVALRITSTGLVRREQGFDVRETEALCREMEREFGLCRLESPKRTAAGKKVPVSKDQVKDPVWRERRMMERKGERSIRVEMQLAVTAALDERPIGLDQFRDALARRGVTLDATTRGGKVTGLTYVVGSERMKGSDLGRAYSAKQVTEQLQQHQEATNAQTQPLSRGPRPGGQPCQNTHPLRRSQPYSHPRDWRR
jgi:hypothetical protein